MKQEKENLLEIHSLFVSFRMYEHGLEQKDLQVISDLSLTVRSGEIVAVAGSSGSGKCLLEAAILGILPENAKVHGKLCYKGQELTDDLKKRLRGREIALVPQSVAFLNPLMKVGAQVEGHIRPKQPEKRKALFRRLDLAEQTANLYPFQLSGGMARRILVSIALMTDAELIIADEPTPSMGLEQSLKALTMFREMANEGKAVVLITHDIDLAVVFADRVAVFYAGTTIETTPAKDFKAGVESLRHPYSKALWRALPENGFTPIPGFQPYSGSLPKGCLFAPRCPLKTEQCEVAKPPTKEIRNGEVRCYHAT